jgi:hypothetical protein
MIFVLSPSRLFAGEAGERFLRSCCWVLKPSSRFREAVVCFSEAVHGFQKLSWASKTPISASETRKRLLKPPVTASPNPRDGFSKPQRRLLKPFTGFSKGQTNGTEED